jgi:hypothetical protein
MIRHARWALFLGTVAVAMAAVPPPAPAPRPALIWHDVSTWGVEGRAWPDQPRLRWYDRLPASAQGQVTEKVWELSRDTAGMMVRFKTDSASIWARYRLRSAQIADVNMSAMGVSGLDLYGRDSQGHWRWAGATKPLAQDYDDAIVKGLAPGRREYAAYLPLRNGIERLEIGVEAGASFEGLAPRSAKPLVFYGTSITHGYSASRPGMVHTAILGRHLDRPVVNLGFNGNGRMDLAVGRYLVQLDAAVYVIDCEPNLDPAEVRVKCPTLVRLLRKSRPNTPIVLVEDRRNANSWILPLRDRHHTENHAALQACFAALKREGVKGLYYIPGDHLYGDDGEGSSDGSHPNDLGFMRQTAVFEPVLRQALGLR